MFDTFCCCSFSRRDARVALEICPAAFAVCLEYTERVKRFSLQKSYACREKTTKVQSRG